MISDALWMEEALIEARKGIGLTAPNPAVGAVIVKDGEVIGRGWHRAAGQPHAEREALADARERHGEDAIRGATAYVTLEPCSTTGRTPPCCDGLIEAGIFRVVWGATDPNPAHVGAAEKILNDAGVETSHGMMADECEEVIRGFASVQTRNRPWVIAKSAMSIDGRITRPAGEGQWLTSPESLSRVQQIRSQVDAIVTSGATLRADNPALTLRVAHPHGEKAPLWRVVFSRGGGLPAEAQVFTDAQRERTLVVMVGAPEGAVVEARALVGNERVAVVESIVGGLEWLCQWGIQTVMVEAGGRMLGEWIDRQLVDEFVGFVAPMLCGGGAVGVAGVGVPSVTMSPRLSGFTSERIGNDVMVRGVARYPASEVVASGVRRMPCVFFDRDGVVNDPRDHYYVTRWSEFHFMEGIIDVIAKVKAAGCLAILVTSQRGVGKGRMSEADLAEIHQQMQEELERQGAAFDGIYSYTGLAPDGPGAKPRPDMIYDALADHPIDLTLSVIIGDADRDIEMGRNAGIRTIRLVGEKAVGVEADATVQRPGELLAVLREMGFVM
ncbi:bifunctional diaminohydroxyphosphoribosylaminopyrimidine deaminase/5-amino-6-(5-phosphoribosylamino)uracil reductase RibD [Sulfuriroseicoccus oceanibius]|uniref:Riboflavin biosynthesis protein RibD n=1 Tax=Sulfuriroseicoccus oceanibius TaxID=2707525 RepID=A0A7T7F2K2_9BACT|nr:bifunctional diaminohydroxyphosphoribosylaminopyrimidine deaminase/5-amino-6-(5-phosphoribosylamino)uracil reductase RibD [Sulfuriroseicoccus oceanibius]QQL45647.1 bifunctional diaminohydroxyphosphoribosylaminopyrimidine deaminase/5-amino-6-(5-phosphoribosylamino)uracil reductase RibD [Sulfuriroseicoccus oceanibius]